MDCRTHAICGQSPDTQGRTQARHGPFCARTVSAGACVPTRSPLVARSFLSCRFVIPTLRTGAQAERRGGAGPAGGSLGGKTPPAALLIQTLLSVLLQLKDFLCFRSEAAQFFRVR